MGDPQADAAMVLELLLKHVRAHTTREAKSDLLGLLMIGSYQILRTIEGDDFVIGWLESALAEVRSTKPPVAAGTLQ